MIVDMHVHLIEYQPYHPWVIDWMRQSLGDQTEGFARRFREPANMVQYLREAGVDYAVVLAEVSPITTGMCSNEQVVEFCRGHRQLIPFASINPFLQSRPAEELERCVRELGMRGVKLYPTYQYFYPNDAMLYPLYARAVELGIPVMVHTGSSIFRGARLKYGDPLYLDDVAVDFPGLNLILVHGGRGFWYDRAFFLARLHPNVHLEISGLPPQHLLNYFPEVERIPEKVLFGSDFPGMPFIRQNIEAIRGLPLKEKTKELILGGNAARLLGLAEELGN